MTTAAAVATKKGDDSANFDGAVALAVVDGSIRKMEAIESTLRREVAARQRSGSKEKKDVRLHDEKSRCGDDKTLCDVDKAIRALECAEGALLAELAARSKHGGGE